MFANWSFIKPKDSVSQQQGFREELKKKINWHNIFDLNYDLSVETEKLRVPQNVQVHRKGPTIKVCRKTLD